MGRLVRLRLPRHRSGSGARLGCERFVSAHPHRWIQGRVRERRSRWALRGRPVVARADHDAQRPFRCKSTPFCPRSAPFCAGFSPFCVGFARVDISVTDHSIKGYARIGGFGPLIRRKPVEISKRIDSWLKRIDEERERALVQLSEPVNKFPDFVRYLVKQLKVLCPMMGKVRIAQVLARAGLHLGATTVGRILKETEPVPEDVAGALDVIETRLVTAKRVVSEKSITLKCWHLARV